MRSIRGGAAGHPAHQVRPAVRLANTPTSRSPLIGFRVAREAPDLHRSVPAPAIPGRDGIAIASGGSPESAFDGDSATFWVSPERGVETKGRSWIGFDYSLPHSLRRIEIEQPDNPVYQQNRVLVQSSRDGGRTWETAADGRLESTVSVIQLPPTEPATLWRLLADSGNQREKDDAWAATEIRFFATVPKSYEFGERQSPARQ